MKQSGITKQLLRAGVMSTALALGLAAHAAEFYQTGSMAVGAHWNQAFWTNATETTAIVPSAGNTYVNGIGGNTRTATDENFLGDLITIQSGGTLQFKHGGSSAVSANVVMEDGSLIKNGGSNGLLEGTLSGSGKITIDTTGNSSRKITIGSLLKSDNTISEFNIIGSYANDTTFTNSANTFTGVWNMASSGYLKGAGLGLASGFIIGGSSGLDLDADFVNTNADITVTAGGKFILDQDVEVYTANIWGIDLANGTYTGAELKADPVFGAAFAGSSDTSTLTILYEQEIPDGETIYQSANMTVGIDWNDPAYWQNSLPPISTNNYVNDNGGATTNDWSTRTPGSGSGSFGGYSLTLTNNARLTIKSNGPWTINNFNVWAGSSINSGGPSAPEIAGGLNLKGTGAVVLDAQVPGRMTTISSLIDTDATVTNITVKLGQTAPTNTAEALTSGFILSGPLNDFDGVWVVEEGALKGQNFGDGSFLITDMGYLDFNADYSTSGDLTIEANPTNSALSGMILLDENVTVGSATIWGETLADGLYFGGDLKIHPIYGGAFDPASSDGAILVVGSAGGIITQVEGHISAGLQEGWLTTNSWSNGEVPSPAYHYLNNTAGWQTRSPVNAIEPSPIFLGKSLTIADGAKFTTKHSGTATVSNLNMFAGTEFSLVGIHGLNGNLNLKGTGAITFNAAANNRRMTLNSLVTATDGIDTIVLTVGSGFDPTNQLTNTGFELTDTNNTFTGVWDIQQGRLKGAGLGQGSFLIGEEGYLDLDADYYNTNATLTIVNQTNVTTVGQIKLDQDITVDEAVIWGVTLPDGTHTGADLKANGTYGGAFDPASSDTATITVVSAPLVIPEIGDIEVTTEGSDLVIGFVATNYVNYTVLADDDLVNPPEWHITVTNIVGVDGPVTITNDTSVAPNLFYKVDAELD